MAGRFELLLKALSKLHHMLLFIQKRICSSVHCFYYMVKTYIGLKSLNM